MQPFISFYTPTYRRPTLLAACLQSVSDQTVVDEIEQVVVPDHVGLGVAQGLFGRLPYYASALHGQYVHILADDDVLAAPDVVERLIAFVRGKDEPPVVVVRALKGALLLPSGPPAPPRCGSIDLGCFVLRSDVFHRHVGDYGLRYEGDFDHAMVLYEAGWSFAQSDVLFVIGAAMRGAPESA